MISNNAGYDTYLKNKVLMASPEELTLLLYDGAIKFVNKAVTAIGKKQIEVAHNNIMKAQRIVEEFRATLNFKYPVAKEFDKVYEYIHRRLVEANLRKDVDILEECLEHLRTMRDTWKSIMEENKSAKTK